MEPFFTGANHDLTLTADLLYDTGWRAPAPAVAVPDLPSSALGALTIALAVVGDSVVPRGPRRSGARPRGRSDRSRS
jgi:hypothetical protein